VWRRLVDQGRRRLATAGDVSLPAARPVLTKAQGSSSTCACESLAEGYWCLHDGRAYACFFWSLLLLFRAPAMFAQFAQFSPVLHIEQVSTQAQLQPRGCCSTLNADHPLTPRRRPQAPPAAEQAAWTSQPSP
jgi:hypothetical protein